MGAKSAAAMQQPLYQGPPPAATQAAIPPSSAAWQQYCRQAEVPVNIQSDLRRVLAGGTKVVLLLDDSGSMSTAVRAPGDSPFLPCTTTRWSQLQQDTAELLTLVTSLDPHGVDIFFMNRHGMLDVTTVQQVATLFSAPPIGDTPMLASLRTVIQQYGNRGAQKVLLILVTDGEPSDGDYQQLFRLLKCEVPANMYVSFVECNDNEEEMSYLTGWDLQLPRFHNQEDYGEELKLVRLVNGPNVTFTRANYIQMIVLSPMFPLYAIDIRAAAGRPRPANGMRAGNAVVYQPPSNPQPTAPTVAVGMPVLGPGPSTSACCSAAAMPSAPGPSLAPPVSPWEQYCRQAEVPANIQSDLLSVLQSGTRVVLLLDDSNSMKKVVRRVGGGPPVSRWSELMTDVFEILQLVTTVCPDGIDLLFMNRPGQAGVRKPADVAALFAAPPKGHTPMLRLLRSAIAQYQSLPGNVLLILVTDGEPSDGSYKQLYKLLMNEMPANFYISFVECNDNEEEMNYLTGWDLYLPRFHNQEDYGEELKLMRLVNGPNTKFTRANYIQMIVLSPMYPSYAADIRRFRQGKCCCCVVS